MAIVSTPSCRPASSPSPGVAARTGNRENQTCAEKSYSKKGRAVVEANWKAIDETIANLHKIEVPAAASSVTRCRNRCRRSHRVRQEDHCRIMAGAAIACRSRRFPTTALGPPHRGVGQRNLAQEIPCGTKSVHLLRQVPVRLPAHRHPSKVFPPDWLRRSATFKHIQVKVRSSSRVCTSATRCAGGLHRLRPVRRHLPAVSKIDGHRALEMRPQAPLREASGRIRVLPQAAGIRSHPVAHLHHQGREVMEPCSILFGLRRLRRNALHPPRQPAVRRSHGDRNATGCSSIYGGNLPTTPTARTPRGAARLGRTRCSRITPNSAWASASASTSTRAGARIAGAMKDSIGVELAESILNADQSSERYLHQRNRSCIAREVGRHRLPRRATWKA